VISTRSAAELQSGQAPPNETASLTTPPPPGPSRPGRWLDATIIAAAFAASLAWTWGTWPDVQIDFGREAYVAWRLSLGEVLYRDVAVFNGPLSPYVNAGWFRLFGVSLWTLFLTNAAIAAAGLVGIYALLSPLAGRLAATVVTALIMPVFGTVRYDWVGNFNYLAPYSHECTHGLFLAVLALWLTQQNLADPPAAPVDRKPGGLDRRLAAVVGIGLVNGLIFLTKLEVSLATLTATGLGCVLAAWRHRDPPSRVLRDVGVFFAAMAVGPLVAWGLLSIAMPSGEALRGTLGSWVHVFNDDLRELRYFARLMGTDTPVANLWRVAWLGGLYAGLIGAVAWGCRRAAGKRRDDRVSWGQGLVLAGLGAVPVGLAWVGREAVPWLSLAQPLPLAMGLIGLVAAVRLWRGWRGVGPEQRSVRPAMWFVLAAFGGVMLLKMVLNTVVYDYGFFLAMPAAVVAAAFVLGSVGVLASRRRPRARRIYQAVMVGGLLALTLGHLSVAWPRIQALEVPVGHAGDRFFADRRGEIVNALLTNIERNLEPDATLAVLPEGVMVNYLARQRNPTRYTFFMPSDVLMFGEGNIVAALDASPPDYVVLMHKDTSDYGHRFFGQDYGLALMGWVSRHYRPVGRIGSEPFRNQRFGVVVLKRTRP